MDEDSVVAWWREVLGTAPSEPSAWDRQPDRDDLYADYRAFCKKRKVAMPEGEDVLLRKLRAVMPRRGFAVRVRVTPDTPGAYRRSDAPVRFEHLCIPPFGECRRALDAATGTDPDDWPELGECAGGEMDPDVSSVENWWNWKLECGVTVPDETDDYGWGEVYWNRTPAADLLFSSYRGWCEDQDRAPVRPGFFLELFEGVLPRENARNVQLLLLRPDGEAGGTVHLEYATCYELPTLEDCRGDFGLRTGRTVEWPAATAEPGRRTRITDESDRAVARMWWLWKLKLGCVIPDDRYWPGRRIDGPVYEWCDAPMCATDAHYDCSAFCARHGRPPIPLDTFLVEWTALMPECNKRDDNPCDEIPVPPLGECRAWFEKEATATPIIWPTCTNSGG